MDDETADLRVLRVFTDADGSGGNPLGVHLVGAAVPPARRQAEAARLGFSETVFVDDPDEGVVEIRTPTMPLPFAGHPLVGTAWLLAREGADPGVLRPPAGAVPTWTEGARRWIRGRASWAPPMVLLACASPAEVERLQGPPPGVGFAYCWAYLDEERGLVRARAFAAEAGIAEDEATGSAALRLAAALDRPLTIRQGAGSELRARPGPDGTTEVGGLVARA